MNNKSLVNIGMVIGVVLIAYLGLLVAQKSYDVMDTFQGKNPKNTISISAEGKVSAKPDLAEVSIGILTQGDTADGVQAESSKKINKIIDFIKKQGLSDEDINTSQFNIYPNQDYREGRSIITGYQANQTITIKVHGVNESTEKLSKILGGVTSQGANQVNGVSLSFNDPDEYRQQAREKAIIKAKEKAAQLAEASGLRLGKVVSVSENSAYPAMPYLEGIGGYGGGGDAKAVSPNIEPGSQDIIASMNIVFEVK
jgi:uncharacterized protein YggE